MRAGDGMKIVVYRKATPSSIYLHYASHHPDCIKKGVIKCLTKQAEVACSEEEEATTEERAILKKYSGHRLPKRLYKTGAEVILDRLLCGYY